MTRSWRQAVYRTRRMVANPKDPTNDVFMGEFGCLMRQDTTVPDREFAFGLLVMSGEPKIEPIDEAEAA